MLDASQISRRIKLRQLTVFVSVVQWGSMARAAEHLAMSQPVISKMIADLEQALGIRLLDRSRHGVEPTLYGRALLKRSAAIFNDLRSSVTELQTLADPTSGEPRMGSRIAKAFHARGMDVPKARVSVYSVQMVLALCGTGRFLAILPSTMLHFSAERLSLKALPVDMPAHRWPIGIVTLKERTPNPATRLFIECAQNVAKPLAKNRMRLRCWPAHSPQSPRLESGSDPRQPTSVRGHRRPKVPESGHEVSKSVGFDGDPRVGRVHATRMLQIAKNKFPTMAEGDELRKKPSPRSSVRDVTFAYPPCRGTGLGLLESPHRGIEQRSHARDSPQSGCTRSVNGSVTSGSGRQVPPALPIDPAPPPPPPLVPGEPALARTCRVVGPPGTTDAGAAVATAGTAIRIHGRRSGEYHSHDIGGASTVQC